MNCKSDNIYPFNLTHKTFNTFCNGCDRPMLDRKDCDDCLWLCFPCTITIDLITLIPFAGIYFGKKCKSKDVVKVTTIVTQPAKMPTPIQ
jgi:hypothetical protein